MLAFRVWVGVAAEARGGTDGFAAEEAGELAGACFYVVDYVDDCRCGQIMFANVKCCGGCGAVPST